MNSQTNQEKMDICVTQEEPKENPKPASKSCCHVNREMLPFKLHYFLLTGAVGFALPYLVVFAKNRVGVSTTSLAAVLTVQQLLYIFTKPLICYIADYLNKLKLMMIVMTVVTMSLLFALLAMPKINAVPEVDRANFSLYDANICDSYERCKPVQLQKYPINGEYENSILFNSSEICLFSKNDYDTVQKYLEILPSISNNLHKGFNTTSSEEEKGEHDSVSFQKPRFFHCEQYSNGSCVILTSECFLCCHAHSHCNVFSCVSEYNSTLDTLDSKSVSDFKTFEFWLFVIIWTVALVCENGLTTLSNTACCESVQKYNADFGRQKLYGTIGWGCASAFSGLLNDYTGDYLASWIVMLLLALLTLVNLIKIKLVQTQLSENILKDMGTVLASMEYLAYAWNVFMCGLGAGVIWYFLIWFLTTIGGSLFLCGLTTAVQSFVGKLPFMFFSGWIIKKVGHFNVVTCSLVAYCIRFLCYSYLHNPWFVLPIEILHGVTSGILYPTIVSYAKLKAKPGTEATSQAVLFTLYEGLGAGLACIVTGMAIDSLGTHQMFFFASIFSGCGAVLSVILHLLVRRKRATTVTK